MSWVFPGRGSGGGKAEISFWMSVAVNISGVGVGFEENILPDVEEGRFLKETRAQCFCIFFCHTRLGCDIF